MINRLVLILAFALTWTACGTPTVRVMTYNIHHGRGIDGHVDLDRIAALIRNARVDIVALNEVDRGTERTDRRDLATELAKLCGMKAVFERNIDFQGGEYGNAVLTRLPISSHRNLHYKMVRPHEQRGLLQVTVTVAGQKIRFFATHIDHRRDDTERISNVSEIIALVNEPGGAPIILCGDFNDTPGSRTHSGLEKRLVDSWTAVHNSPGHTYPSEEPRKRIDYVWVQRDSGLTPVSAIVVTSLASDHLPLIVEIELRQPPTRSLR